jgi:hypothetical protein
MKFRSSAIALVVVSLFVALPAVAGEAAPAFDKMKTLVGTWEGKSPMGPVVITYRLVSGGSVLESEIKTPAMPEHDMVTMIHPDGSRVLLTHYCAEANQPRMAATGLSGDGKSIDFGFVDVSNLKGPDAGHMQHVAYTFRDADHYSEVWTYRENGKETPHAFEMTRRK